MARLSILFVLVVVTSHACVGVVLRPNWFPYFRRNNQTAQRLRYSSDKVAENAGLRQTRSGAAFNVNAAAKTISTAINDNASSTSSTGSAEYPCKEGITVLDCLVRVLNILNRAIEREGFYPSEK